MHISYMYATGKPQTPPPTPKKVSRYLKKKCHMPYCIFSIQGVFFPAEIWEKIMLGGLLAS